MTQKKRHTRRLSPFFHPAFLISLLTVTTIADGMGNTLFAREKERITEQGSSIFYRSWRYATPKKHDEKDEGTKGKETAQPDFDLTEDKRENEKNTIGIEIEQEENGKIENVAKATTITPDEQTGTKPTNEKDRQEQTLCTLYFKFDQANYINEYKSEIDTILYYVALYPDDTILLTAHTDERGTVGYNQTLSERRAKQLYRSLIAKGIDGKRMECIGRSKLEPAIPHAKNEQEHQLNRRVVVSLRPAERKKEEKGE